MSSQSSQFSSDVSFSLFAKTLYLVTRVALPPLVLAHVSLADYGIWSIAFIVISYLGLTASGFASVYIRRGALAQQAGDIDQLSRLISTGIISLGLLSLLLFAALASGLPWLMESLGVATAQRSTASTLVLGACAIFLADITFGAYAYLLHGIGRIRTEQKIWVLAYLFEMAVAVVLLQAGRGIQALLVAFALRYALSISAAIYCTQRLLPGLRFSPRLFDRATLREFLGFGSLVQVSMLCANALQSAERVLAGFFLGAPAAALFDLGNKLPSTANSIPSAVSTVTLPAAARSGAGAEVTALYYRATRMTALLTALPMPFLALFALPICQLWLGRHPEVGNIAIIMTLLTLSCHVHSLTGPGSSIFRGIGQAGNEFIYHGLRAGLLALSIAAFLLLQEMALLLLAQAIALAGVLAALAYLWWNHRQLTGSSRKLGSAVLWPALAGYPAAILTALLLQFAQLWPAAAPQRQELILPLALAFGMYLLLAGRSYWRWVLNIEERQRGQRFLSMLTARLPFAQH